MKSFIFLFLNFITISSYAQNWYLEETTNDCTNRHENALATVKNKVYLLGGRGIKPVEEYDPETKTWTKLAPSPIEIHHFQAITLKNEIFVLGALTGKYPHETPLEKILIFNPKKNEWREGDVIPENRRRGAAACFVFDKKIYMVCGITDGHWDGHVAWFDEYNPKKGTWKVLKDAPRARDHVGAGVIENSLILAAGRRSSAKTKETFNLTIPEVDVYDFKTEKWKTMPSSSNIPTQRAGASTLTFNNEVVVIGGESAMLSTAHRDVESFNLVTQKWTKLSDLNQSRHGTGAVLINNKIYTAAGSLNRGGGPELNTIEVLR